MTLHTRVYVHGPIAQREVFDKVNEILGIPALAEQHIGPVQGDWHKGQFEMSNAPGQGFDAWVMTWSDPLGAEIVETCDEDCEQPCEYCPNVPPCHVLVSLDTGYSSVSRDGKDCTTLHASVIVKLHEWLTERGLSLHWQNEYTGEFHEGLTGLAGFVGNGDQAMAWFTNEVQPALHRLMQFDPNA